MRQENGNDYTPILKHSESVKDSYKSMQDIVFERLRDLILSGSLQPGESLNTIKLTKMLEVSRTPIREALNRLTSIGLVENIPNKGAYVRQLSIEQIIEVYYIRAALAGICARLATTRLTDQMKAKMERLCDEMETAVAEKEHDIMLSKNYEFHHILYKAADSPRIEELVAQYYSQSEQYRALGLELPGRYSEICEEHRRIMNALLSGDKDKAEYYAREHHFNTAKRIANTVGEELDI